MELFKRTPHIDFMKFRKWAIASSLIVIVLAIVSFFVHGLNLGIDFTGGVIVEVVYPQPMAAQKVEETLTAAGFSHFMVQNFGSPEDILVRLRPRTDQATKDQGAAVMKALEKASPGVRQKQLNTVGPQVGSQLRTQGAMALVVALILIFIYLLVRYEWRLALGAIFATLHDVVFIIGIFSFTHLKFDLTVLAAVLAMLGYSVNDTVVIFDRIREDFKRVRRGSSYEVINLAVNQTLSRTIMTHVMTQLVVIALLVVGGPPLREFSIALSIGIVVGTYSSIYVASASAYMLGVDRKEFMTKKKPAVEGGS